MTLHFKGPLYAPEGLSESAPFDATAAFEANLNAPSEPVEEKPKEPEEVIQEAVEPVENTGNDTPADTGDDDDPEVELPNGSEVRKFKLKQLNELISEHGTLKAASQKAGNDFAAVSSEREKLSSAYNELIKRAEERAAPYANIDWLALMRDPTVDDEAFKAIRADAEAANAEVTYLKTEADSALKQKAQEAQKSRVEAAKAAVAELTDPVKGIKGFGQELHGKLVAYGKANGVADAGDIIEPHLIRLLHKAWQFDQGAAKADTQVQKVVNNPSRVIRPGSSPAQETAKANKASQALKALKASPTDSDAITNAFIANLK